MSFLLGNRFSYGEDNVYESYDFHVSVEQNGYLDFMMESYEESARLTNSLYAADSMLESMYHQGIDVTDLVTEAANSFFEKTKEYLKKLWAKIQQWFEKVKRFFQIMFTSGKEFIKKFESDIRTAASNCNGFKYQFYDVKTTPLGTLSNKVDSFVQAAENKLKSDAAKISLDKGNASGNGQRHHKVNGTEVHLADTDEKYELKNFNRQLKSKEWQAGSPGNFKDDDDTNAMSTMDDIAHSSTAVGTLAKDNVKLWAKTEFKGLVDKSFENSQEFKTELREAILGDSREEFEDFSSGPAYTEMIDWVRDGAKSIEKVDKNKRTMKKMYDKYQSEINDLYKDQKDKAIRTLDYAKTCFTEACNYTVAALDTYKGILKTLSKDSQSVLKSLLRHKPKTESYSYKRTRDYDDVLEYALNSL